MLLPINKTNIVLSFIFISLLFNIMFLNINATFIYEDWIRMISIIVILHAVLCIFHFKLLRIPIFSLSTIFVMLLYIFHFSNVIVFGIFDYSGATNVLLLYPSEIYRAAIYSCFIIINCTSLGIMLSANRFFEKDNIRLIDKVDITNILYIRKWRNIGLIILILTFPLRLYIDISTVLTGLNEGYLVTYENKIAGVLYSFSELYIIGLALLLLTTRHQPKKQKVIFIIIIVYLTFTMLSGNRIDAICFIITLSYIYFMSMKQRKKIKIVNMIMILTLIYLGCIFLLSVSLYRNASNINFDMIIETFQYIIVKRNPIVDLLYQFGATVETPIATVNYLVISSKYGYGLSYLLSFINVVPNIGGIFTELSQGLIFGTELQKSGLIIGSPNIGGSYIGELIFNFGYFSVCFALLFGMIIQKISKHISFKLENNDYFAIACCTPVFWGIISWVRGYYPTMIRSIVWGLLLVYLVNSVLSRKGKNK